MVDRKNVSDIFNVVKDDFNWIIEDMTQHNELVKEKMIEAIKKDDFEEVEDIRECCLNMKSLMEKIEAIKSEYASLFAESDSQEEFEDFKKDLPDWTGLNPNRIKLFGQEKEVKSWREVLSLIIEELIKINPKYVQKLNRVDDFKGRTREYFSYDTQEIEEKYYKVASNGLYYLVNSSANSTMSLCRKVLRIGGYEEADLQVLDYRGEESSTDKKDKVAEISADTIKLSPQYASLMISKQVFKEIVQSMIDRNKVYGKDYINPREVERRFEKEIIEATKYTTAYPVVINIIKYLKELKMVEHFPGTKKGKYIVVNDETLGKWIECNI